MSQYFSNFPIVSYNGRRVRDITRRTNFIQSTMSNPMVFLPYTIEDGMKAEDVAYHYYGSVEYTWMVLLANDMLDPYTDWPISEANFNDYLIAKYTERSGKKFYEVIEWLSNTNNDENIAFYYKVTPTGETIRVGPETFASDGIEEGFSIMRLYEYEMLLNESKRNIQLVDIEYRDSVASEFNTLIRR